MISTSDVMASGIKINFAFAFAQCKKDSGGGRVGPQGCPGERGIHLSRGACDVHTPPPVDIQTPLKTFYPQLPLRSVINVS